MKEKVIKYLSTFFFIFVIITFILTFFYLDKIDSCKCFLEKNDKIKYIYVMKYIQLFIIIICIIDYFFVFNTHIDKLGTWKVVLLFIIFFSYIVFIYYSYLLSKDLLNKKYPDDCICINGWERYIIYKEFLLFSGAFIVIIISLLFGIEHELLETVYKSSYTKHIHYLSKSIFQS